MKLIVIDMQKALMDDELYDLYGLTTMLYLVPGVSPLIVVDVVLLPTLLTYLPLHHIAIPSMFLSWALVGLDHFIVIPYQ